MRTIQVGQDVFQQEHPSLLGDLFFQELGHDRVWSREVDHIITTWRRSGIVSVVGPSYRKLHIDAQTKGQLVDTNAQVVESYDGGIKGLANLLDLRLGINK